VTRHKPNDLDAVRASGFGVDHHIYADAQEALVPHRNAPLTETGRLRLARCIVEDGWPVRRAAERFQVSHTTAYRWATRYREQGPAGMSDLPCRPRRSPGQLSRRTERRILGLRVSKRLGPARIAWQLHLNPSTVHRVLSRYGCPRLACLDRATNAPVRRYERDRPGELVHVDVKKLGNIPDGGGHRAAGRARGFRNKRHTTTERKNRWPVIGYGYLHTALDDHTRLAYTEILADERKDTAAAFLTRAHAWYATLGIIIERVLSDNGNCYRSRDWADACAKLAITHKRTRPYRPQTNGKVERYHRTLADEWAYAQPYRTETARRAALPAWLHTYNNHRGHTALGGRPPASRVTNLSGQNI
jgi:transposase InsO family protein